MPFINTYKGSSLVPNSTTAFGDKPETALGSDGDAFRVDVHSHVRVDNARDTSKTTDQLFVGVHDAHLLGNNGGEGGSIDLEDAVLAEEAVFDGVQNVLVTGNPEAVGTFRSEPRQSSKGNEGTIVPCLRQDHRKGRIAFLEGVDGNTGTHLVATRVLLRSDGDSILGGDGDDALRAHAGRKDLEEGRASGIGRVVDEDDGRPFGQDEQVLGPVVKFAVHYVLRLVALVLGAALGVGPDAGGPQLHLIAGVVDDVAPSVHDGEAAASPVHVSLVGDGEMLGADPRDAVGLAEEGRSTDLVDHHLLDGVDLIDQDLSGAVASGDVAGGEIDKNDAVDPS